MEADSKVAINYHTLEAEVIAELSTRDRFAPIEERQDTGVLALDVISTISHAGKSSDVEFIQGDSFQVEKVLSSTFLENLHHPWLVIEDAHENLVGVLEYLDKFTEPWRLYLC
ncbi:unnamed protein product [Porites evermanni]|uniref:CBS domain-containing protein n=1 Tax=Porites evermanni TaxID=104178 RepID=A0ABN8MMU0_9CNID|nr:unnamed protein product [Porites evermanni]